MTYSSSLALGRRQNYSRRNQNVVSLKAEQRRIGPISNTIILVVLACLLGLLYLTQVTKTNAFGYQINSLQKQQSILQTQHSDLEVTAAQLQSATRIQTSSVAGSLTAVTPSATVKN